MPAPERLILTTIVIAVAVLMVGMVAAMLMYYHLQGSPISPQTDGEGVAVPYFWPAIVLLMIVEVLLIGSIWRAWRYVRRD